MSSPKKSTTALAATGSALMWTGMPSPCAAIWQSASRITVEKSLLELRICDMEVRSITSTISCAIESSLRSTIASVTGSGSPSVAGAAA